VGEGFLTGLTRLTGLGEGRGRGVFDRINKIRDWGGNLDRRNMKDMRGRIFDGINGMTE
jgi:hypothetical protein